MVTSYWYFHNMTKNKNSKNYENKEINLILSEFIFVFKKGNIPKQKFWRKLLTNYTNNNYTEFISEIPDGDERIIFRFSNKS